MGDQFAALRSMGVTITELGEPDRLPARITGPIDGAETSLPGDTSSQFITGLLLAGGASSMQVALTTEPISRPYIEMTSAVIARSAQRSTTTVIESGALVVATSAPTTASNQMPLLRRTFWPQLRSPEVGFVSTASGDALQGDVAFAEVLGDMGCRVDLGPSHVEVSGRASRGIEVDLSDISDTAPTLPWWRRSPIHPLGSTASASSETRKAIVSPVRSPSCGGPVSMRRNTTTALPSALRLPSPHLRHL